MAKGNEAPKPRAAAASAASAAVRSVQDAVRQIEQTKTHVETLASISALYAQFLTQKDTRKVFEALDVLHEARVLESHVWRVRDAALGAPEARHAWHMTVLLLVSHAARRAHEPAAAWRFVGEDAASWRAFMASLTSAPTATWTLREKATLVQFLICCFASLDVAAVAGESVRLVSLAMWAVALSPSQRALEFADHPKLARLWKKLKLDDESVGADVKADATPAKKKRKTDAAAKKTASQPLVADAEKAFIAGWLQDFTNVLTKTDVKQVEKAMDGGDDALRYVALSLTLLTDLLSSLPTRRFLEVVVRRKHVLTLVRQSPLVQWCLESRAAFEISALTKQIERLEHVLQFPVDAHSGKSLTTLQDRKEATTHKIQALQLAAFGATYRDTAVETLAIIPVSAIVERSQFKEQLNAIAQADRNGLEELGVGLGLFQDVQEARALSAGVLTECFVDEFSAAVDGKDRVTLPTELDIWNDSLGEGNHGEEGSCVYGTSQRVLFPVLPIPKLGLQYLNLTDFLERSATLSRVESAEAVRRDLEDAIRPLDAVRSLARNGETVFRGFSQVAVPLQTAFSIMAVEKPKIGEAFPSTVSAQFDIELDTRHDIAAFDLYQHHEVVYLVTIRPTRDEASEAMGFANSDADQSGHFAEDFGVLYVRCAELTSIEDEAGKQIKQTGEDSPSGGKGRKRTMNVEIDGAQYKKDLDEGQLGAYEYVNLVVRRDPRKNNFKAVSDSISSALLNSTRELPGSALPSWLYDLYLGYGDPSSASFEAISKSRLQATVSIPLHHAFRDAAHAVECCSLDSSHHVHLVDAETDGKALAPKETQGPYTLVIDIAAKTSTLKAHRKEGDGHAIPETHPLTREQGQLVVRGTAEGLTLATGAPGTGKSEALAQLLQNIYQGTCAADEKIMLVARSTAALDKLLDRLKLLPFVDEASIVRLGAKRSIGDAGNDFSCQGRVDFLLQRRIDLLQEVDIMAKWMERVDATKYAGISSSASYSCENALFFYRFYMKALFDDAKEVKAVKDTLLHQYFAERTGAEAKTVTELQTFASRMEGVYGELHRLQPFELLQMPAQRRDVYLMQHARVIAMTSRHAALQFRKLVDLKLKWTSVVVEDATQLSEIDTLIPLIVACQSNSTQKHMLKRLVMVGDSAHRADVDLAPLKSYSRCDTSLFSRLLRLSVPRIELSQLPSKPHSQPRKTKPAPPPKKTPSKK